MQQRIKKHGRFVGKDMKETQNPLDLTLSGMFSENFHVGNSGSFNLTGMQTL